MDRGNAKIRKVTSYSIADDGDYVEEDLAERNRDLNYSVIENSNKYNL
jgi:hypothetical protein